MSGTVPTILAGSITQVDGLKDRPVFFLNLNHAAKPTLVVKGEAGGDMLVDINDADAVVSITWSSKLMKNVQHKMVNTKHMTPAEFAVFKAAAQFKFAAHTPQGKNLTNKDYHWVKMPFVEHLSNVDYIADTKYVSKEDGKTKLGKSVGSMKQIKENIRKMSDDAFWRELGKIIAVDVFNGNNDRIDLVTGDWRNRGNIMVVAGGLTPVIGLDTFDPRSGLTSNLNQGGIVYDELRILNDANRRRTYSEACTNDIGKKMKTRLGQHVQVLRLQTDTPIGPGFVDLDVKTLDKLFLPFAPVLADGIRDGADRLKAYLKRKIQEYAPAPAPARGWLNAQPGAQRGWQAGVVRQAPAAPVKTVPKGILDRMAFLGW